MSQETVDKYVRWIVHHARDEAIRRAVDPLRANYVTGPKDVLHRGPYHRLLKAGIPEAAIPAVLEVIIASVDVAVETVLWREDQLRTTRHLRTSLWDSDSDSRVSAGRWAELSGAHLTYENHVPLVEASAKIRTAEELDATVRAPVPVTLPWTSPLGGP